MNDFKKVMVNLFGLLTVFLMLYATFDVLRRGEYGPSDMLVLIFSSFVMVMLFNTKSD
jgi:hypothetical protein